MGFKAKFDINKLFEGVQAEMEDEVDAILTSITAAMEEAVKMARSKDGLSVRDYQNQTGALRSSIGFQIYDHGELFSENFEGVNLPGADKGLREGRLLAQEAAAPYKDTIVVVLVAGMDYALAVESKGYDVLTGTTDKLQKILEEAIETARETF